MLDWWVRKESPRNRPQGFRSRNTHLRGSPIVFSENENQTTGSPIRHLARTDSARRHLANDHHWNSRWWFEKKLTPRNGNEWGSRKSKFDRESLSFMTTIDFFHLRYLHLSRCLMKGLARLIHHLPGLVFWEIRWCRLISKTGPKKCADFGK